MAEFLVVYDYGMGGVWGFATAPSQVEIERVLPDLTVVHERPLWLDGDIEAKIREVSSFVVGDEATYPDWLKVR
jgi:hypothetical protein